MRKKELFKLNDQLFKRLETAKAELEVLKKENEQLLAQIKELTSERDSAQPQVKTVKTEPIKALESKIINHADLCDDTKYGATVIGKIVVSAAQFCQRITSLPEKGNTKELVNLILGRTEVAKAEILKAVSSDQALDAKITLIDNEFEASIDYFHSVMAQR